MKASTRIEITKNTVFGPRTTAVVPESLAVFFGSPLEEHYWPDDWTDARPLSVLDQRGPGALRDTRPYEPSRAPELFSVAELLSGSRSIASIASE
jgi:hypothetical protein